jgi:hypothetical protein
VNIVPVGRRLATMLLALALVALPAVVLRAFCVGMSCETSEAATARVPFCPLPAGLRNSIAAGFREGRSPDALAITSRAGGGVATDLGAGVEVPWLSIATEPDERVPLVFAGDAFSGAPLPPGTALDDVAPTLAEAIGYRRPHPEVASGAVIPGIVRPRREGDALPSRPALIVEIVWKGVGTRELESHPDDWPNVKALIGGGSGTLEATVGSSPSDPAAVLTTIGTGGIPGQHGITGTRLRNEEGAVVRAWSPRSPGSIIATLADELDRSQDQRAHVAAVLTDRSDRGIVGDGWYLDERDQDDVVVTDRPVPAVTALLDRGFGADGRTASLAVVIRGTVASMDADTGATIGAIRELTPDAAIVVTATGSLRHPVGLPAEDVIVQVNTNLGAPVVASSAAGGLFLDRRAAAREGITVDTVTDAMLSVRDPRGRPAFADAFPAFIVSFGRYC